MAQTGHGRSVAGWGAARTVRGLGAQFYLVFARHI